jgi:hypothetical protein
MTELNIVKTQLDTTKTGYVDMQKVFVHLDELSSDLDNLVDTKDLTADITIECGNKRFRAHSLFLSTRSGVFKQLCKQVITEKSFRIRLEEIKPDIVKEMLHYIYSGRCNLDEENAIDIYAAAERFSLSTLKEASETYLIDILGERNALQILSAFDSFSNIRLKNKTIQYINAHHQHLFESKEWAKLKTKNPDLVYQVYESKINKIK